MVLLDDHRAEISLLKSRIRHDYTAFAVRS